MKATTLCLLTPVLLFSSAFAQEDIMPRPPKRPGHGNELARLIRDTRVGEPCYAKNLVVYPLFTSGRAREGCLTMDDALGKGLLRITEKGRDGNVPELLAENRADEPVFLLAGEIVTGGKQNRVISQDILLAPRSGPVSLGVFCVERGRWAMQSTQFAAEKDIAHNRLRQQLSDSANSQGRVWAEVSRKAAAVAASPAPTAYLGAVFEDRAVKRGVEEYTKPLSLPRDANGMAVVIGSRVAGVEIFGDSATFARLRDKLLRSYAVDAMEHAGRAKPAVERGLVEEFLRRAERASFSSKESVGIGRLLNITGGGLYGSMLLWHEQTGAHGVVHASLFPEIAPAQPVEPPVMPRPWRR